MSSSLANINISEAYLTSSGEDNEKAYSFNRAISSIDYFEDLLSPSVTCYIKCADTDNLYHKLPIRGYDRLDLKIQTALGVLEYNKDNPLYVTAVNDLITKDGTETFTLSCATKTVFDNEATRCRTRFKKAPISTHVENILKNTLSITSDRIFVETTANAYGFMGNQKKPFHTCTWLAPKSIPFSSTAQATGTSGSGTNAEGVGTSGFFFFENQDGFHFKSIDTMCKDTISVTSADTKDIPTYTSTSVISQGDSTFKVIHSYLDKNTDIIRNLRVGLYSNLTYFYNPIDWNFSAISYKIKDNHTPELGKNMGLPGGGITDTASRILVRIGDTGMESGAFAENSGRDDSDMAKSFSRYNLLFTQSLNIVVPCNVNLKVGELMKVIFPTVGPSSSPEEKSVDKESSGNYLIRSLRHHFDVAGGQNTTSLNLVRDSYRI